MLASPFFGLPPFLPFILISTLLQIGVHTIVAVIIESKVKEKDVYNQRHHLKGFTLKGI